MGKIPIVVDFRCVFLGHEYCQDGAQCLRCGMPSVATVFERRTLRAYIEDWLRWKLHGLGSEQVP